VTTSVAGEDAKEDMPQQACAAPTKITTAHLQRLLSDVRDVILGQSRGRGGDR
jgi:hypothetical protein